MQNTITLIKKLRHIQTHTFLKLLLLKNVAKTYLKHDFLLHTIKRFPMVFFNNATWANLFNPLIPFYIFSDVQHFSLLKADKK